MRQAFIIALILLVCSFKIFSQTLSPSTTYGSGWSNTVDSIALESNIGQVFFSTLSANQSILMQGVLQPDCIQPIALETSVSSTTCGLPNGIISLSAGGALEPFLINWSNGLNTGTINQLTPGTYTVTITGVNGCTASTSAIVNGSICPALTSQTVDNITQNSATIHWQTIGCANKYRIILKKVGAATQTISLVTAPNNSFTLTNLEPGTTYQVRMRTQCSQNGSVLSALSPITTFTTLNNNGITCLPPSNISVTTISPTSISIQWDPSTGALQYNLRYRLVGTTTWSTILINGASNTVTLENLTPASTYEFQMRTKCNNNPNQFSIYSSLFTFNTPALRIGESSTPAYSAMIYPNPTSSLLNIDINIPSEQEADIYITDVAGRVLLNETETLIAGNNTITYRCDDLSAGLYLVHIVIDGQTQCFKMVRVTP